MKKAKKLNVENVYNVDNQPLFTKNFLLICAATFCLAMTFYFLLPALPLYLEKFFNAEKSEIGLVIASYTLAALLSRPLTGFFIDKYGSKFLYYLSFFAFIVFTSGYWLAATVLQLFIIRFFHGVNWSIASTSGSTLAVELVPPSRRGEGMGYFGLSMTLAMTVGPLFGLVIYGEHHYNWLFLSATISATLGFVCIQFISFPKNNRNLEIKKPFRLKNLIHKKAMPLSVNMFLLMFIYGGIIPFASLYGKEIGVENPGLFFTLYAFGVVLIRITCGKIFDREGPRRIIFVAMILLSISALILGLCSSQTGFLCGAFVMGAGNGAFFPIFQAMVNNLVQKEERGIANSTYMTALDVGIGVGGVLMGYLAELISLQYAFLSCFLICVVCFIFFFTYVVKHYEKNLCKNECESNYS